MKQKRFKKDKQYITTKENKYITFKICDISKKIILRRKFTFIRIY